ncbi:MAG: hypothetical protein QOH56_849 [Pseudonocardiales bacterium]|jgi:predicted DNA-binding transcriptional regulator AlpA|nr:hypothetical protein [Pseudonocardiales bacterium]
MTRPKDDPILTVPEVADRLRTTAGTMRYWRHVGRGPQSFKLGRRVVYYQSVVEKYIADQEAATRSHADT